MRLRLRVLSAFDRHRLGTYEYTHEQGLELAPPQEDGRRCIDGAEMIEAGMAPNAVGRWSIVAAAERARQRFAKAA
jgi:hypothetical protein